MFVSVICINWKKGGLRDGWFIVLCEWVIWFIKLI